MKTPSHPGIDMVHAMRQRAGYTEDWEVNQALDRDIISNLRRSRSFLDAQMAKQPPHQVSDKDISELRKFEVAIAYAQVNDVENPAAQLRVNNAIQGMSTMDQPLDSTLYANRKKFAENQLQTPASRVTTTLEF